jgi:predicted enzyme related to lactoylglutathione lyase
MTTTTTPVTGVDFVMMPTQDLAAAVEFYGTVLGLPCSVHMPERNFAEFEAGPVTINVAVTEHFPMGFHVNPNPLALHVDDVAAAREELGARGLQFAGETFDSGVCHMAFFTDPDGNPLMLHHRYAPRVTNG